MASITIAQISELQYYMLLRMVWDRVQLYKRYRKIISNLVLDHNLTEYRSTHTNTLITLYDHCMIIIMYLHKNLYQQESLSLATLSMWIGCCFNSRIELKQQNNVKVNVCIEYDNIK